MDDVGGDGGSLAGGWTLNIVTTGGDYAAASGTLTFNPGVLTQPVTIAVNGDATNEANETFFVNLIEPSNATVADGQGVGTINNDDGAALAAPTNVVATATSATNVNVTFTAAPGAASYRVYRRIGGGAFTLVGSPAASPFNDPTAAAGTAYLYMVRSFAGTESADSNVDRATTILFTDPTLTVQTTAVKLAHFNEMLAAVNAVRILAGLGTVAYSAPLPGTSVTLRSQHMMELRFALDVARSTMLLPGLTYTDSSITNGVTAIKAVHMTEVRNGVK
jgi:hypothetical protein